MCIISHIPVGPFGTDVGLWCGRNATCCVHPGYQFSSYASFHSLTSMSMCPRGIGGSGIGRKKTADPKSTNINWCKPHRRQPKLVCVCERMSLEMTIAYANMNNVEWRIQHNLYINMEFDKCYEVRVCALGLILWWDDFDMADYCTCMQLHIFVCLARAQRLIFSIGRCLSWAMSTVSRYWCPNLLFFVFCLLHRSQRQMDLQLVGWHDQNIFACGKTIECMG